MRISDLISRLTASALVAGALGLAGGPARAADLPERPQRVVSVNLCTDQLAMLVAGQGQLLSVSDLAYDPRSSAMSAEAEGYAMNHGLAEEIYLMQPDLVLAGRYTARPTTDMLERLGIPVVYFDIASSLDDVRGNLRLMGDVLHREARAEALVAAFDARLDLLRAEGAARPRAAFYYASGYSLGDGTLSGQILRAAGFRNIAAEAGLTDAGTMPLELLAVAGPEVVVTSHPYPGASRAEEIMRHPVVRALRPEGLDAAFSDRDWVCGTPFVLDAIEDMAALRRSLLASSR